MNSRWLRCLTLLALASAVAPAMADDLQELRNLRETTIALVNALVQQGVLTREKADELIRQAEQAGKNSGTPAAAGAPGTVPVPPPASTPGNAAQSAPAPGTPKPVEPGVIRVPYVPQVVKEEIREEVKDEVMAQAQRERWWAPGTLPEWLERVSFLGDARFRGQLDRFPNDNQPNAPPALFQLPQFGGYVINNTQEARNRMRLRVRFGADARVNDKVDVIVRLTTGTAGTGGDPSTENENLGNYNARGNVGFDLAYIFYRPTSWMWFKGGRVGNPFYAPTTLVWGDDLSLEGAVAGITPHLTSNFQTFLTAGAFPILDVEPTPLTNARSKWLYAFQGGFNWQIAPTVLWRLGGALYDYRHIEGVANPNLVPPPNYNLSAAPFRQKGNSVFDIDEIANTNAGTQNYVIGLASKFHELNATTTLDVAAFGRTHVVLDSDYVRNLGYNYNDILMRTGQSIGKQSQGIQERITVGDISFARKYAWNAYVGYRHVESDAVVDAFTDADFHLGGTNATGYYLGARFAFERNSTIGFRWYSAKQITGLPLAIDVLQIDLIAAF
jgi:hypothetical protein